MSRHAKQSDHDIKDSTSGGRLLPGPPMVTCAMTDKIRSKIIEAFAPSHWLAYGQLSMITVKSK